MIGPAGCGKTHLSAGIANELLECGIDTQFSIVPEFLDQLRASYRPDTQGPDESVLVERASTVPVLILDDLGAHNFTEWVRNRLFAIINYRVNHDLPCIITTNLSFRELNENIGDRTASRLVENCVAVIMNTQNDIRFSLRPNEVL